jgi:hypothetical protein
MAVIKQQMKEKKKVVSMAIEEKCIDTKEYLDIAAGLPN